MKFKFITTITFAIFALFIMGCPDSIPLRPEGLYYLNKTILTNVFNEDGQDKDSLRIAYTNRDGDNTVYVTISIKHEDRDGNITTAHTFEEQVIEAGEVATLYWYPYNDYDNWSGNFSNEYLGSGWYVVTDLDPFDIRSFHLAAPVRVNHLSYESAEHEFNFLEDLSNTVIEDKILGIFESSALTDIIFRTTNNMSVPLWYAFDIPPTVAELENYAPDHLPEDRDLYPWNIIELPYKYPSDPINRATEVAISSVGFPLVWEWDEWVDAAPVANVNKRYTYLFRQTIIDKQMPMPTGLTIPIVHELGHQRWGLIHLFPEISGWMPHLHGRDRHVDIPMEDVIDDSPTNYKAYLYNDGYSAVRKEYVIL